MKSQSPIIVSLLTEEVETPVSSLTSKVKVSSEEDQNFSGPTSISVTLYCGESVSLNLIVYDALGVTILTLPQILTESKVILSS